MIYTLIKDVLQRNCGEVSAKHFSGGNSTQLFIVHAEHLYTQHIYRTLTISSRREGKTKSLRAGEQTFCALGVIENEQQILKMNER
jgi:hypothetical protein